MSESRPPAQTASRLRVLAWALWDCGSTGLGAIVVTFVFSVYLTRSVGDELPPFGSQVDRAQPGEASLGRRRLFPTNRNFILAERELSL